MLEEARKLGARIGDRFKGRKPEVQQGEAYGMLTSFDLGELARISGGLKGKFDIVFWSKQITPTSNIGYNVANLERKWNKRLVFWRSLEEKLDVQDYGAVLSKNRLILVAPNPEEIEWIEIHGGKTPSVSSNSMPEAEFKECGLDKVYPSMESARALALEAKRQRDVARQAATPVVLETPAAPTA
jgi:hypothetical protein